MTPAEIRDILIETMGAEMQSWFEANRLNFSDEMAEHLLDNLSAKLVELGLKIVPVEATAAEDRVRHYVRMRDARPIRLDDEIHGIHKGTEWEASLYLADLRAMVSAAPVVLGGGDE